VTIQEIALFLIGALLLSPSSARGSCSIFFYPIQQELAAHIHLSVINYKYYLGVLVAVVVVVQDK